MECWSLDLNLDLKSAELERVRKERRYDLVLTRDVEAHIMGHSGNGVEWCTRATHAKKIEMPSKEKKMLESEPTDCSWEV